MSSVARTIEGIALRRRTDEDVLDRALRGDPVAFSEVYRRYHSRVFAFCLSRLLSREAATDATQEVFVRVLASAPDTIRHPSSWLFGIANHVCIDVVRREHRESPTADCLESEACSSDLVTAEDRMMSRQDASNALLALRRTRPRYRTALILHEIHQQPMSDIAEALDVSVPTAYTILSRARDAFGRAYADVLGLPPDCRAAIEMVYRRSGTGLSASEESSLGAHLDGCARCRREAGRAENGDSVRALLPLLPLTLRPRGLLSRAAAVFGIDPWPVQTAMSASSGFEWSFTKVAALALAAGTIVTAAAVGTHPAPRPASPDRGAEGGQTVGLSARPRAALGSGAGYAGGEMTQSRYRAEERALARLRLGAGAQDVTSGGSTARYGGPSPSSDSENGSSGSGQGTAAGYGPRGATPGSSGAGTAGGRSTSGGSQSGIGSSAGPAGTGTGGPSGTGGGTGGSSGTTGGGTGGAGSGDGVGSGG